MTKHAPRYIKVPGHVHASEFCQEFFGRSYDWFKRNRALLETTFGFPHPIPPETILVYYAADIAAWRAARAELARRGALATRLGPAGVVGTAFFGGPADPPAAEGETPNWPALKGAPT